MNFTMTGIRMAKMTTQANSCVVCNCLREGAYICNVCEFCWDNERLIRATVSAEETDQIVSTRDRIRARALITSCSKS